MICSKHHLFGIWLCLASLMLGTPSVASAEASFQMASLNGSKRFMPIASQRDGIKIAGGGLRAMPVATLQRDTQLRSFKPLDRQLLMPTQSFRSPRQGLKATAQKQPTLLRPMQEAAAQPARILKGDEIIALFGSDAPPVGSGFEETLTRQHTNIRHAWPLPTRVSQKISSGYGMRRDPFHGQQRFHGGIDIAAAKGTSILASAEGMVTKVERNRNGLGNYIAIQHRDGTESYYGHLNSQRVHVGQRIRQGQIIGTLGSTGRSTGPHLDYRIKKNGKTMNPMLVLNAPAATRLASR